MLTSVLRRREGELVFPGLFEAQRNRASTIPNSLSRHDFETNYSSFATRDVLCFDTVGYLSAAYVAAMMRKGMTNAKYLVHEHSPLNDLQ